MSTITTGKARASYVNVFTPQEPVGGGEPKYSVTLLIPKTDVTTLNAIYAEIERAKQEGVSRVFNGTMPANVNLPIHDGDGLKQNGEPFGEECRGCMVLRTSSKNQPTVVDINVQPILNSRDVYSGCYVRASVDFFAYNQGGNRGISCGLNAVQKIEDGEPLVSRVTAQEAFGGNNAYTGTQGYGMPGQPYQQTAPQYQQPYQQPMPQYQQQAAPQYQQPAATPQYAQSGAAPQYQQPVPVQQMQANTGYDPVTGMPISGGVMGI